MQFVLRCPCKGTVSSMAVCLMNTTDCLLPTVLPKCLNWWGHISSFLQPHSRAEKPARTEQELDLVYIVLLDMVCIVLLDMVYSDIWMYSHLSQLNVYPHLSPILLLFLSHAHPHGVWALLSTWLTTIVMDYHLPGLRVCSPIIHSSSTVALSGCFFLLIPSAAIAYSMHNREPSYLSPLLWLQASCGRWDQQEPEMKVLLQYLHKDSLPAVERPRSPKWFPRSSVAVVAYLHGQAGASGLNLHFLGLDS